MGAAPDLREPGRPGRALIEEAEKEGDEEIIVERRERAREVKQQERGWGSRRACGRPERHPPRSWAEELADPPVCHVYVARTVIGVEAAICPFGRSPFPVSADERCDKGAVG